MWFYLKSGFRAKIGIPYTVKIQHPTAIAETTIAETTTIKDKLFKETTVLEEIELDLFTGFEDMTALEDKKCMTVFSATAVVGCI